MGDQRRRGGQFLAETTIAPKGGLSHPPGRRRSVPGLSGDRTCDIVLEHSCPNEKKLNVHAFTIYGPRLRHPHAPICAYLRETNRSRCRWQTRRQNSTSKWLEKMPWNKPVHLPGTNLQDKASSLKCQKLGDMSHLFFLLLGARVQTPQSRAVFHLLA